ncbi:MAG: flagellar hook protein FlgE [Candidatus Coatesbacteria bacterium]|nr:flagellar hook protein FlgE [Candidatus Coatesbacteria bacterium]
MLASFYSGLSGLSSHVLGMDVLGNNIANVNTVGFKGSLPMFQDILSQSIGDIDGGGQVGLGVSLGSITPSFSQGAFQSTDVATHLAIQGNGFFVLGDAAGNKFYTRAGNFAFDKEYDLVNANGLDVLGWSAMTDTGAVNTSGQAGKIHLPLGMTMDPEATTLFKTNVNLNAEASVDNPATDSVNEADVFSTSLTIYDSLGAAHTVTLEFTPIDEDGDSILDRWDWTASVAKSEVDASTVGTGAGQLPPTADGEGVIIARGDGDEAATGNPALDFEPMRFDSNGKLISNAGVPSLDFAPVVWANGAADQGLAWQIRSEIDDSSTYLTGYALNSAISYTYQDGYSIGEMESVVIRPDGTIVGVFSNGTSRAVAQIALATFPAPTSLTMMGENMFAEAPGSGNPTIGAAKSGGRGTILGGNLEMANVDLTSQFTSMIIMQRGFEACSKIITTADDMIRQMLAVKR